MNVTYAMHPDALDMLKPYDPATQKRVVRDRLHALEMINERFARNFRMALFNLLRRSSDVIVNNQVFHTSSDFEKSVEGMMSLSLITMKPLRGNMLMAFPAKLVFMVVENLFGGGAQSGYVIEDREFSATEQRIIGRLTELAMESYQNAWRSVYNIEMEFIRSESQPRFANLTNSPNDIVVNTTYTLEMGNFTSQFQIVVPYAMLEPIRAQLSNISHDRYNENPRIWRERMSDEITEAPIELVTDFLYIDTTLGNVMNLKVGDILQIELPERVTSHIDGIPVMESEYGTNGEQVALRVTQLYNHAMLHQLAEDTLGATAPDAKDKPA